MLRERLVGEGKSTQKPDGDNSEAKTLNSITSFVHSINCSKTETMLKKLSLIFMVLPCLLMQANAQPKNDSLIAAAKAWWHALTFGDTSYVKDHSTEGLTVTYNSGRSFTRAEILAQMAYYSASAPITADWSNILVQSPISQTSIVTNEVVETVGKTANLYRWITVLVLVRSQWKVAAVQSTRKIEIAPGIPLTEAGDPASYPGSYRTPAGGILTLALRDSCLILTDPSGQETKLSAIGPDLFEIPAILSAGNVRFSFARDGNGKIISMTRIANKIMTMLKVK